MKPCNSFVRVSCESVCTHGRLIFVGFAPICSQKGGDSGLGRLNNLLMTALVLTRLNVYKTTYFKKASIVDQIYLKPSIDADNGP